MRTHFPAPLLHGLFCLAFLALPYVFAPGGFSRVLDVSHNPHERTNLISYVLMLVFFYLNYYRLIPRLYFQRRFPAYVLSVAGCFGLILALLVLLDRQDVLPGVVPPPNGAFRPDDPGLASPGPPGDKPPFGFELSHALFLFLVGIFGSLSVRINQRYRQVAQEKTETELSFLRAQINPHFLFNTLNSIYALAIEGSPRTAEAVVKLSGMMRYVIHDARGERVLLARELDYLTHYVDLQRLRLDESVRVEYTVEGRADGLEIAPMLLISFVENAFKYGVNPERPSTLSIRIALDGPTLTLHVANPKVRAFIDGERSGIGLENTRARLNLLYPNQHTLTIRDEAGTFTVDLRLTLA
jgi:hypothetical protein